jgi:4-hydroxybenzoyl-CoA thioesterase
MPFETTIQVRFGDVDAAGIVFYPRYFEMLNTAVEDWFDRALGLDFAAMHFARRIGIPAVNIEAAFVAPSVLGDMLTVRLEPRHLGRTSCKVRADFSCVDEERLSMSLTIVCVDLATRRPLPWPPEIRGKIAAAMVLDDGLTAEQAMQGD